MVKKVLISLFIILFMILVFSNNIFANTTLESLKTEANELLNTQIQNDTNSISKYYDSLVHLKEQLNTEILKRSENTEELQKLKYQVSIKMLQLEESIKISYVEDNSIKYTGYIPTILGVNLESTGYSRKVTILSYGGRNVSGKIAFDGCGQYTDLKTTECVFCQDHGGSLTSVRKSEANIDDGEDGTLYVTGNAGVFKFEMFTDYVGQRREGFIEDLTGRFIYFDRRINRDKYGSYARSERYAILEEDSVWDAGDWRSTRSIANFTSTARTFNKAESYILAHAADNSGSYPTYVQQAYWLYQEGAGNQAGGIGEGVLPNTTGFAEDADGAGTTIEANAKQLAQEGLKLEEIGGTGNSAQNTSNMNEATVVYNSNENCWYAGPFTISYEREILQIENGATSKIAQMQAGILANKVPGVVEYKGINDIKCYDEAGSELRGVEYVITNRGGRQAGDESYKFPYPNETFYIKIPYRGNETAKEFKTMNIELFDLTAEGKGADLNGTYYKLRWGGRKYANLCQEAGSCSKHRGETVGHLMPQSTGHNQFCAEDCTIAHWTLEPCDGVAWCYTHGGRTSIEHLKSWDHYLVAADSLDGPYDAQKLLCVEEAEICMLFIPSTITIEKDLTLKMGGTVFEDEHSGKESDQNGIKDRNEKGIKWVKVTITPIGDEGETRSTYTDENGKWYMEDVKVGQYDVEFEYDGQTYKTTKYLASGNQKDLNDSKAKETEEERQEFNNKFYEITETLNNGNELITGTAVGTDGSQNTLNYTMQNRASQIITRDTNTNIPLDLYKMKARTSNTNLYYPIENLMNMDEEDKNVLGQNYKGLYPYLENINLGLIKRAKADFTINMDVYQAHARLKDTFQVFTHNARNIDSYEQMQDISNYVQKINPDDYSWRWDDSLTEIYPDRESSELQVYIDYKIMIRNQSEIAMGQITELVNYYDEEMVYEENTPISNFASWAVVQAENEIGELTETRLELKWQQSSKYNKTKNYTENGNGYTTMYTDSLKDIMIEPGGTLEVHIIYRVKRDIEGPIIDIDANDNGKENVLEINAYKTYVDGKVEGKIDEDSNPGNAVPLDENTHEDDTEKAPYFKLSFDDAENIIEGNVWEDLRTETLDNNQIIGDGIRQTNEPTIGGVKVELIEIVTNEETEEEIQRVVRTATTVYTSDGTVSDGGYRFENVPGGIYKLKFTYGTEEQLIKDIKYNGQDYKATVIDGEIRQETTKKAAKAEIILTIDTSGSMSGIIGTVRRAATNLVNDLFDNQEDLKIGVVKFTGSANVVCYPTNDRSTVLNAINRLGASGGTNIAAGINTTVNTFTGEEGKEKIMVLFTDGHSNASAARNALINAADNQNVYPISVLTSKAVDIFGTQDNPTRGKTYHISNSEIQKTFSEMVYGDIQDKLYITPNRSYASEVEIETEITVGIETKTRQQNIKYSEVMINENGTILDTEYIDTLKGTDREKAIRDLAENTYITAITDKIKVNVNNNSQTGTTNQNINKKDTQYIRQVNLGLTERPKVQLETTEEIVGIQLILSDGTVLIDTENGLTNYVNAVDKKGMDKTISLDNELQQGSTIKIKYKITVTNTGEVDRYGSYFEFDLERAKTDAEYARLYEETIPTTASKVYSYVNKNMVFRKEDNEQWNIVTDTSTLSDKVKKAIQDQDCTIIETSDLEIPLYPEVSLEGQVGALTSVSTELVLSKVMSTEDAEDSLTYTNSIEIVERYNKVGRRDYIGVPGNYKPNSNIEEYDSAKSETLIIVPPYGEQRLYYILTAIIIAIISLGVVIIKKYIVGYKNAQ